MDDGRGLSQTLLVLVRYNCVSNNNGFHKTLVYWIGWGGGWGGGCAKMSNDNEDLNQVLQNATYFQVIVCLRYEFCRKHLIN